MKKTVPNSSKLKPANFVRRVLSRTTTNHSKTSLGADEREKLMGSRDKSPVNFESELHLLKKQIASLQITVNSMHNDTDKKEKVLAVLAKEKEQLAMDLKRQKRSNVNLKQQLEDERSFYYKEKEQYCNEMNTYKKLKQRVHRSESKESIVRDEVLENTYKNEIAQLKDVLNQTLEANYNLSVKFLRMKNTKLSLTQQLSRLQRMHDNAMLEYRKKLEQMQTELDHLVDEQFTKPIPPSNKKYLQIIKQNGNLIHENLCLQLEVDRLNLELERMKMLEIRNDTNSRLKYIHNTNKGPSKCPKCKSTNSKDVESQSSRCSGSRESKSECKNLSQNSSKGKLSEKSSEAKLSLNNSNVKLSERSSEAKLSQNSSNPKLSQNSSEPKPFQISSNVKLSEKSSEVKLSQKGSDAKLSLKSSEAKVSQNDSNAKLSQKSSKTLTPPKQQAKVDPSKYDLMNVSNSNLSSQNDSEMYYNSVKCCQAYRTHSAPEIVQTTNDLS